MNTFSIGDIHGNIKALKEVLLKAPISKDDRIIFLGDYGDGFEGTSDVVDKLLEMRKEYECIFLQGNHDYWIRNWINTGLRSFLWTEQGGNATIDSYRESGKMMEKEHQLFWNELKHYYISEIKDLFVHGGWDGQTPFLKAAKLRMSNGHLDIHWSRSLIESIINTKYTSEFKNIFIGHTATRDALPFFNQNIIDLDTGAGWAGKLTIMNVETKEYWQSSKNNKI